RSSNRDRFWIESFRVPTLQVARRRELQVVSVRPAYCCRRIAESKHRRIASEWERRTTVSGFPQVDFAGPAQCERQPGSLRSAAFRLLQGFLAPRHREEEIRRRQPEPGHGRSTVGTIRLTITDYPTWNSDAAQS